MKSLEKYIRAHALKNAIEFNKTDAGRILPKLFQHGLEKSKIKEIMPELQKIIKEINSLSQSEKQAEFKKFAELVPEHEEKPHELAELKNTKKVIMRFEPSPSGPLHVGHAYVLGLNSEYVKKYNGKLILRIGDTNPENIYPQAYNLIQENAEWLTNNVSEVIIQSDRLPIYYKYFEKLIDLEKAYVCVCDTEEYKNLLSKSEACPCRSLSVKEQKERWKLMFTKYAPGEAVARIKTNLKDKNPAMRDFPVFRINETKHARQGKKYRVWPLMNMSVLVDDIESNVTHIIRAKDHADNAKRQEIIYKYLNKQPPQNLFVGRINFLGMPLSTTETRKLIESKKYSGWDDIRLPFLPALKKRGFLPESLIKYALDIGVTLTDKTVSKEEFFKTIESHNRKLLDPTANRYSFVKNPVEIKVKNPPKISEVKVPIHPDKNLTRAVQVSNNLFISSDDFAKFAGKEIRLLHLYNIQLKKDKTAEFTSLENKDIPKINWVSSQNIKCKILLPDGNYDNGIAEQSIKTLKKDEVLQFERYAFVKLDKRGEVYEFWYTHK